MDIAEQLHSNTSTPLANKITCLTPSALSAALTDPLRSENTSVKTLINQQRASVPTLKTHGSRSDCRDGVVDSQLTIYASRQR